ncbi:unnamed protein product [Cochlearia groenlandica]
MSNKLIKAMMILVVVMMVFSWSICEARSLSRSYTSSSSSSSSSPQRFFKVTRRPNPLQHHYNNHHDDNDGYNDDDNDYDYPPESFTGFLPKTMPIPPSAPSKKHNVYGLQSTHFQRYP